MKKRLFSLLLAALLVSTAAVSCGKSEDIGDPIDNSQTSAASEEGPAETEPEKTFDDFPAQDLGGASLRLGDTEQYDIYRFSIRDELNGDVLNDAIYNSLRAVEEKLNVVTQPVLFADPGQLSNAIVAGDDACDIMTGQDLAMANLALDGYTMDISHMEQLDFSAPWWPEHAVSSYRINDNMLLFSNYMSYFGVSRARAWFINKQLAANYGLTVPYADVFAGTWTLDKLHGMIGSVYEDTNGNGTVDMEDTVGYVNQNIFICMQPSMGIHTFASNSEGKLEFVFDLERASTALDKMYAMIHETKGVYQADTSAGRQDQTMFQNGKSLFYYDSLGMAETILRDTDVEYGILCTPKLDETQADYIAGYTDYSHAVPKTIQDETLVGWGIEALTASGYYTIIPAFVDVSLTNKYVYDEDSAKVIALIGEKMHVELAYSFSAKMANMFHNLLNSANPSKDLASYYAANQQLDIDFAAELNDLYGAN